MSLPNLKHLQYLLMLHKHQHFNKAAQACFVSQSTLSSAILKLEEQFGCQLIERDHKAFIFTPQGEQIVAMAQQLIADANELMSYAKHQGQALQGMVKIGCIPTIAPFLLTELALKCQQRFEQLSLFFIEATTEVLLQQLAKGEIDCAVLALPIEFEQFRSKTVGKDGFYLAASPKVAAQLPQIIDYQTLPEHSVFLLTHEHCLTAHTKSACQLADASKIHHFSASSLATLVQMTAFHQGATFLPAMAVKHGLGKAEGLVMKALPEHIFREIGLLWRPTSMRTSTYLALAELLTELLAE